MYQVFPRIGHNQKFLPTGASLFGDESNLCHYIHSPIHAYHITGSSLLLIYRQYKNYQLKSLAKSNLTGEKESQQPISTIALLKLFLKI